jgi:signal transduction histidine kinase
LHKDGHIVWVLLSVSLVRDDNNNPNYLILQILDITERKEVERMKNEFVSIVSHELRTPLTSIRGSLGLIAGTASKDLPDKINRLIQIAHENSERLILLINDILDISKIEAGKLQLEMQVFDVSTILDEIKETIQPLASQKSNKFTVDVSPDLSPVHADCTRLKQCLLNLLSNACKFTHSGEVDFSIEQEQVHGQEFVTFRVADTGVGLSEEQAARLFQPFSQADASTTRKFGGTGLGLAITKNLCEAMGGSIDLQSQPGAGSTFTIRLPAAAARKRIAAVV